MPGDELPVLGFADLASFEIWLEENHARSAGLWLKIAKKGSGAVSVTYADALAAAICYGWIDGQKGRLDEEFWLQRFTPRKPGSKWSKVNTGHADTLTEAGRMRPAGQREIDQAQSDGRWAAAYAGQRTAEVPPDLAAALAANDQAREFFATLSGQNRYAILYRIGSVKRPETRARKIAQYVEMLAQRQTLH
jgi:uncharacterized protein YdeI (YjbR/CyaY-like superfamily)